VMIDLATVASSEIRDYGHQLLAVPNLPRTFEQAATTFVTRIYEDFQQPDGSPLFALLRIYRIAAYDELEPELKTLAQDESTRCAILIATRGIEPHWNDRRTSNAHRVLSILENQTPMLSAAFSKLGLIPGERFSSSLQIENADGASRFFHVPEAEGSPQIPAQRDFVVPYKIQSVVGLGTTFASGNGFMLIGFSRGFISHTMAATFAKLTPCMAAIFEGLDGVRRIWGA